jgi:hypothetical protein
MSFSDAWKRAGQDQDDFDPADGSYTVRLVNASAFEGRDGRAWAKIVLQIIGTDAAGRQFDHFMNLNNDVGLRIAREALVTYGLDPAPLEAEDADIADLDRAMFELVGTIADITVSHKDGYKNIRVQGSRTGESDIPSDFTTPEANPQQQTFAAAAGKQAPGKDDEIPF